MDNLQPSSTGENAFEKHGLYDLVDLEMLSRNDDALMGNLLGILVSMFETEGNNIRRLADQNNWKDVGEVAHKLKTSVTHIRANGVRPMILELEDYSNKSNEELKAIADKVCALLDEMRVYLQQDLDKFNSRKSAE